MNLKDRMIIDDYRIWRSDFAKIGEIVHKKLEKMTADAGIEIMAIEHRVKAEKSLAGKLELYSEYFPSFDDVTDILGERVICYFSDDVDKIGALVEKEFVIDRARSKDKRKQLDVTSFGYLSLHYICSLFPSDEYPESYCTRRFEIQIRTNLQHTWAQIEHDLGYKSEFGVPRDVRRNFSRIAGLLELADEEFVRTRDMMIQYTEDTRTMIIENRADELPINSVSLQEYMLRNKQMREFLDEMSRVTGAELKDVKSEPYIEQLKWFGIDKLGGLQNLLLQNRDMALHMAEEALSNEDLDMISSNVGLRYLCRAELIRGSYTEEQMTDFFAVSTGSRARAARQAKYLCRMNSQNGEKSE